MTYTHIFPQKEYDNNQSHWDEIGITKAKKRMLIATWTSEAWAEMCARPNNEGLIRESFVDTGFLLAKDGSENDLINLQGWVGPVPYDF